LRRPVHSYSVSASRRRLGAAAAAFAAGSSISRLCAGRIPPRSGASRATFRIHAATKLDGHCHFPRGPAPFNGRDGQARSARYGLVARSSGHCLQGRSNGDAPRFQRREAPLFACSHNAAYAARANGINAGSAAWSRARPFIECPRFTILKPSWMRSSGPAFGPVVCTGAGSSAPQNERA
jgi:hypothetical protein